MWPPIAQHYNQVHQNFQRFPSRLNTLPNPQTVILSQFSKPLRFPINENESDFVPIVGQGVKLPKPAPESLITPSSIIDYDKQSFPPYSLQPPTVSSSYLPFQNQGDSYSFFNLDTVPKLNDNHVVNVDHEHLTKTNSSISSTSNIPTTTIKPSSFSTFVKENQPQFPNKTLSNLEQTYHQLQSEQDSSNGFKGHPNANSITTTTISDETQVASPNIEEIQQIGDYKSVESFFKLDYHNHKNTSDPNLKKHSTDRPNYINTYVNNVNNSASHSQKLEKAKDVVYSTENIRVTNKRPQPYEGFSYDQSSGGSNSEISQSQYVPSRSKEFSGNLKEEFIDNYSTFSDPKTNFDSYFHVLHGPTKQSHTRITIHHTRQPQEDNGSSRTKLPKIKFQNQKLATPNIRSKNYKNVRPKDYSESLFVGEEQSKIIKTPFNDTSLTNVYQSHSNGVKPDVQRSTRFPPSSGSDYSDYSVVKTKDYDNQSPTMKISTTKNSDRSKLSSTSNNHKYKDYSKIEPTVSLSFSDYSPNSNGFPKEHNVSNQSSSFNSKYSMSRERPNVYRVHRQNSMANQHYDKDLDESEEEDEYDDEDYYGTDEEYDYSDEDLTDNFKSKLKTNEEYDEASVEEEDETNSSNKKLNVPYRKDQVVDCNKMYKNHKCNLSGDEETYYEDEKSKSSEEYDYIDKEENNKSKRPKDGQYEVTENLAETQQKSVIEISKKEQSKLSFPKSLLQRNSKSRNISLANSSIFQNSLPNKTNTFSKNPPRAYNIKWNHNQHQELHSVPTDQRFSNKPLNTDSHYMVNSGHRNKNVPKPNFKNTTLSHYHNQTLNSHLGQTEKLVNSQRSTYDKTKLHSSSTLPLNPKPLRHMRQKSLTKPTNLTSSSDFDISDRPKPLLTLDSHLTNSLTGQG